MKFKNKTVLITGASRGIGREIAIRLAKDGANVAIAGKSATEGKLPGTIFSVAEEVEKAGGRALPLQIDVRDEAQVEKMVAQTVEKFGRLDALVNNAGAIQLTPVEQTPPKRLDLMFQINVRATIVCSHFAIPHLKKAGGGHILSLSPPLSLDPKWMVNHTPYTISKYGMSFATLGMAEELRAYNIAANALWPRTMIATAAVNMLLGQEGLNHSRTPAIMADAAFEILSSNPAELTGQLLLDEGFLKTRGYTDFAKYNCTPGGEPMLDLYVSE